MTTNTKYNFIICMDPAIIDGRLIYKKQFTMPLILPVEDEDKTKAALLNIERALENLLSKNREPNTYNEDAKQYLKAVNIITTEKVYTDMKITKPLDVITIIDRGFGDYYTQAFIKKHLEKSKIYID